MKLKDRALESRLINMEKIFDDFDEDLERHIRWGKTSWEYIPYPDFECFEDEVLFLNTIQLKYDGELKIKLKWFELFFGFTTYKVKLL